MPYLIITIDGVPAGRDPPAAALDRIGADLMAGREEGTFRVDGMEIDWELDEETIMETNETTDLELSTAWEALVGAGAVVYEWCDDHGVSQGVQAIRLGDHWLMVSDSEGYQVRGPRDVDEDDMVPIDDVDDEAAIRAASDLSGFCAVIGIPGSVHHRFAWFADRDEARGWLDRAWDDTMAANPALGTIEDRILTGEEAFAMTYRDGNRIYFAPAEVGPGFEHTPTEDD